MSAAAKIFPIVRKAVETPHFTSSPYSYREAFLAAFKPVRDQDRRASYYAYDVIIHSRTSVEFVVYDMRDNLCGGIGDETHRLKAKVKASLTREDVEDAIYRAAELRRSAELFLAEQRIIDGYADEIRASLKAGAK